LSQNIFLFLGRTWRWTRVWGGHKPCSKQGRRGELGGQQERGQERDWVWNSVGSKHKTRSHRRIKNGEEWGCFSLKSWLTPRHVEKGGGLSSVPPVFVRLRR